MRRKNPKFENQGERRTSEDDNRNSGNRRGATRGGKNKSRGGRNSRSSNDRRGSSNRRSENRVDRKPSAGDGFGRRGDKKFDGKDSDSSQKQSRTFDKGNRNENRSKDGRRSFQKRDGDSFGNDRKSFGDKRSFGKKKEGGVKRSFDKKEDGRGPKRKFGQDKREFDRAKIGRKFRPRTKKQEPVTVDDGLIRLNKYVANAGICSRRQADEYIKTGLVEVNGKVITEMGFKVKPEDDVRFDGSRISPEKKTYVLLNKPKGYITTTNDEHDRKTVMDLVGNATNTRLFPVGRLDRQTTGVLLFTNDGHLSKKLTHPSHNIKKIYHVVLDKDLHGDDMEQIRQGIRMHEGLAKVDKISFIDGKGHNEVGVEIHIGWNRVVRRIFEKLGYKVEALDRVQFAGLTKKNVKRGQWRILDKKEVNFLKML